MPTKELQGLTGIQGDVNFQGPTGYQGIQATTFICNDYGIQGYVETQRKVKKSCSSCGKEMREGVLSSKRCIYCGNTEKELNC